MNFNHKQWIRYIILHPLRGFEEMRWHKAGSVRYSILLLMMWFLASILYSRLYGFQFHGEADKIFSIIPHFIQTVLLFLTWVTGNWAVCTLLNGEGTIRRIFIYSAYALLPYIMSLYAEVFLSQILIRDEKIFIDVVHLTGLSWSGLLLFSAVKTMHQYTFRKTIGAIFLTICAMMIIFCLLILFLILFQQVWIFICSIYTEIAYRFKV